MSILHPNGISSTTYLANLIDLLLPPQTLLILHLVQPSLLEGIVSSLESPLRMTVNFIGIVRGDVQSIQCIIDTRSIECRSLLRGRWLVKAGQIEAARLLDGDFVFAGGLAGQ